MSRPRTGLIFDEIPTLYDRFRPGYPDAAVDALVELASIGAAGRVLEIGPGTGQLTIPLARRGFAITALEPGPRMAAAVTRKLAAYPTARVVGSRFEDAALAPRSFDLVVSATAWHWLDPDRRYGLAADALRAGGALALLRNDHVMSATSRPYYEPANEIYRRLAPQVGPPYEPPAETEVPGFRDDMTASGRFDVVDERRFAWDRSYTTPGLIGLLRTHSDHRALPSRRRAALVREIRALVDGLGGSFIDRYVTTVCVGRRREPERAR